MILNLKSYARVMLVAALAAGMWSCQDDVDAPDPDTFDHVASIQPNTSILELKTIYWTDETNSVERITPYNADMQVTLEQAGITPMAKQPGDHIIISGRIVSSDYTGNIYKTLIIQDATAAITISLDATSLWSRYAMGQEVVIDLNDVWIGRYNGLMQIGMEDNGGINRMPIQFFAQHAQLNGQAYISKPDGTKEMNPVDTAVVTVSDVNSYASDPAMFREWSSRLVRFNNVYFEGGGELTYANLEETAKRYIMDDNGNSLMVYNSGYSNFWSETLPDGHGDVCGILSYYAASGWQLLLIDTEGCMNFGNPTVVGDKEHPYSVPEVVDIEEKGRSGRGWVTGYIVGAVGFGVTEVASNDDIDWGREVSMPNTLVIAADSTVRDIKQCLVVELPQGSKLRDYGNLRNHPENYGRQIWLDGTFSAVMNTYGITGNKGTAAEFEIEGVEVPGGDDNTPGDGSEAKPYNVEQVIAMNPGSTSTAVATGVWAQGYIVGYMPASSVKLENTVFSADGEVNQTNLVLASAPDVTDYKQCITLQLPAGSVRTALNLATNPGNLGKKLAVKGDVMKYCNGPGIKNTSEYVLDGAGSGDKPAVDPVASIDETFDAGAIPANWSQVQAAGNKAWYTPSFNNNYYAAMTGFKGTAPFDQWLITPPVDMSKVTEKTLMFDTQVNGYGSTTTKLEVYVLTDADPSKATQTKLNPTLPAAPASGYSDWASSGTISLASYSGVVYIGFRYTATTDANYATWCVDNVKLGVKGGGTGGEEPPVVGNGDGSESNPYTVGQVIALNPQDKNTPVASGVWAEGYIVGYMPSSGTTLNKTVFSADGAGNTNLVMGPTPDVTDYNKCISIQLPSGNVRNALNLATNPGNLGKKLVIKGDVMLYCSGPGIKNAKEFKLDGAGSGDKPSADPVASIDETFDAGAIPANWSQVQVAGDKAWYTPSFNNNYYAAMSGYKGTAPFDQWLITPAIDMSKVTEKTLVFDTQVNGYGSTTTHLEVYVLTAADPSKGTKTKLEPALPTAPASGYSDWASSGSLSLASYSGVVYIGFRYTATTDANYATWCVDNVKLGVK